MKVCASDAFLLLSSLFWLVTSANAQSCAVPEAEINRNADVLIGGLFNIHERGVDGEECGSRINPDAIQRLESFLFAIQYINDENLVQGVRFGGFAYDTCGQRHAAVKRAMEYLVRRDVSNERECKYIPMYLGMVGSMYSDPTQEVASVLTSAGLAQISYAAHGFALSDKEKYPYFVRTVPSGVMAVRALLDVLHELGWQHIVVVHGDDQLARDMKDELQRTAGARSICITRFIQLHNDHSDFEYAMGPLSQAALEGVTGVVVLTIPEVTANFFRAADSQLGASYPQLGQLHWVMGLPFHDNPDFRKRLRLIRGLVALEIQSDYMQKFEDYFIGLHPNTYERNPWFSNYWEQVNNCTLSYSCTNAHIFSHAERYRQGKYVAQVVAAVLTFAQALTSAQRALCSNMSGLCPALAAMSTERYSQFLRETSFLNLDSHVVAFDENGDLASARYVVQNVQLHGVDYQINQTALWTPTKGLAMQAPIKMYDSNGQGLSSYPVSACVKECPCENKLVDDTFGSDDERGDVLLVGVFDVHSAGSRGAECDRETTHESSIQTLEAMNFAVDQVNKNPNVLPGVRLTAANLDSCRNPKKALRQMEALINGDNELEASRTGGRLPITAVVGAANSDVSMVLSELLAMYKVPLISYGSTNSRLADKAKYPYFMRTVASDDVQAKAIIDIIKKFNWKYVSVVYSSSIYGESAFKEFLKLASDQDICIATQVRLEEHFASDRMAMGNIAKFYILDWLPKSRVVVLLTTDTDAHALLEAVKIQLDNRSEEIVWLGSDYWGSRLSVVNGVERVAQGSITIGFYNDDVISFVNYFKSLTAFGNKRNPWFLEYWQQYFQCYIRAEFAYKYERSCDPTWTLQNEKFKMADQAPYVMDAVFAVAFALHELIEDHCPNMTVPLCSHARANMHKLYSYMRNLKFYNGATQLDVMFDVLGNAIPRYNVYNYHWDHTGEGYAYQKVGTWLYDKLELNVSQTQGPFSATVAAGYTSLSSVQSTCDTCSCSNATVADIQYQLRHARFTLLGFFPIHGPGPDGARCGRFRQDGFVNLMAFKYAIERLNRDPEILGDLPLGYMAFDTCSDPDYAAMTLRAWNSGLRFFTQSPQVPVITYAHAFVGGYNDDVSRALHSVNNENQQLVQISPASEADDLSNDQQYPHFLRTAAPRRSYARAMAAAMRALKWSYVTLVYENKSELISWPESMQTEFQVRGVCIATNIVLNSTWGSRDKAMFDDVIEMLLKVKGAVGVVVLAGGATMRLLLEAADRKDTAGKLIWVGTDMWGTHPGLYKGLERVLRGSFIVIPDLQEDSYFDAFAKRINLESDPDNPWIEEFWQEIFHCDLHYGAGQSQVCSGRESLANFTFADDQVVTNTINAVYSYAYGVTRMFQERCGGVDMPPCASVTDPEKVARLAHYYIRTADVPSRDGARKLYLDNGDGAGRYIVMNYHWKNYFNYTGFYKIGEWVGGALDLNETLVRMYTADGRVVLSKSSCPGTCNCSRPLVQARLDKSNVPILFEGHASVWGIIVITVSVVGITFALITMLFFIFKFSHPVVMGTTLPLSLLLLFGIIVLYLLNFAFMISATQTTCAFRRLGTGLFYAIIFACLMVKAIRINRVYNKANLASKPSFIGDASQIGVALILICVELVLVIEWLILEPPDVKWYLHNVNEDGNYPIFTVRWQCVHTQTDLVLSLIYVYILVVITLVAALRAHRAAEFHHEALYIAVVTVATVVIMVAWECVYVLTEPRIGIPAVCVGLTVNASVVLALIFAPQMALITSDKESGEGSRRESVDSLEQDAVYTVPRNGGGKPRARMNAGKRRVKFEHALSFVSGSYSPHAQT